MYKFLGKKGQLYILDIKLNSNCKQEEKNGTGPGSCSGGNDKELSHKPHFTSIKESKSWVLTKVSPEPKIGKLLSLSLTDNAMHYINDAKVTYADIGTPGAVGLTKHGDIGPIINAGSNYSVTLHELGHAIQYPSVGSDGKFVYSAISTLDQDLVEPMKNDIKLGNKMPYMDVSSPREFFADAFKHYNNPRTFLLFKESYPATYNEMKKVFGQSKFDVEIDTETKAFIKNAAKNDWIGSYRNYVANGYNGKQIEKIQDMLSPNGDITQLEIKTYNTRISMIKEELKKAKEMK